MQIEAQVEQSTDSTTPATTTGDSWLARVSIADGLYLLVVVAAAIMRFTELGEIPLSPTEAREALAAWQFLQPDPAAVSIGSPAYFTLTTILMPLLGVSDVVMRLVPALFGLGLICLPWLLRRQLGIAGALVSAALLSASPLNSAISRTAGGDAIALFALLLIAVAVARQNSQSTDNWFYTLTAALGLGLASTPLILWRFIGFCCGAFDGKLFTRQTHFNPPPRTENNYQRLDNRHPGVARIEHTPVDISGRARGQREINRRLAGTVRF